MTGAFWLAASLSYMYMHVPAQVNLTVNYFTRSVPSVSSRDEPNTGRVEVYVAANRRVKIIAQLKYDIPMEWNLHGAVQTLHRGVQTLHRAVQTLHRAVQTESCQLKVKHDNVAKQKLVTQRGVYLRVTCSCNNARVLCSITLVCVPCIHVVSFCSSLLFFSFFLFFFF